MANRNQWDVDFDRMVEANRAAKVASQESSQSHQMAAQTQAEEAARQAREQTAQLNALGTMFQGGGGGSAGGGAGVGGGGGGILADRWKDPRWQGWTGDIQKRGDAATQYERDFKESSLLGNWQQAKDLANMDIAQKDKALDKTLEVQKAGLLGGWEHAEKIADLKNQEAAGAREFDVRKNALSWVAEMMKNAPAGTKPEDMEKMQAKLYGDYMGKMGGAGQPAAGRMDVSGLTVNPANGARRPPAGGEPTAPGVSAATAMPPAAGVAAQQQSPQQAPKPPVMQPADPNSAMRGGPLVPMNPMPLPPAPSIPQPANPAAAMRGGSPSGAAPPYEAPASPMRGQVPDQSLLAAPIPQPAYDETPDRVTNPVTPPWRVTNPVTFPDEGLLSQSRRGLQQLSIFQHKRPEARFVAGGVRG